MSEKLVDAKGMLCPRPLILVKKALAAIEIGEGLKILLDNETACENVLRFLQDSKAQPTSANEAGCFVIYATKWVSPSRTCWRFAVNNGNVRCWADGNSLLGQTVEE